ncbi:MAG: hypothetical protein U0103_05865 [Candidatus Obscuribacterales bacterium]|nr:hypothetical protein [Cyanobacteria bacterium SZAS LIN-5]
MTASSIHYYLAFFVIFSTQFFSQPTAVVSDKVTRGHLKILPQFGTGASKRALQFVQRKFYFFTTECNLRDTLRAQLCPFSTFAATLIGAALLK